MLLDTHIFVHLMFSMPVRFRDEYISGGLAVSAVSAGEIACLQRLRRLRLDEPADAWFDTAVRRSGVRVLPLTPRILARSMSMEWEHKDPADRILVQTLLEHPEIELHTRDARILAHADVRSLRVRDCRM